MNRKQLVQTLELTGRALADNQTIPIFTCFCFTGKTVIAYNDAVGIVSPCETDEAFAVNGSTLLGWLKNSSTEEVEFSLVEDDAVVKAGKSTFKLPWFPEEDFLFEQPDEPLKLSLAITADLITGLQACLATASKDHTRPALMGVTLKYEQKGNLMLYSCDGDSLTRWMTVLKPPKKEHGVLLPNGFCEILLKAWVDTGATKGTLTLSDSWVTGVLSSGHTIYGRFDENDNQFDFAMQISKVLKSSPAYVAVPDGLNEALSRARVIADAESAATKLTVDGTKLKLLTETHMGVVSDQIAFGKHAAITVNVCAEKVQAAISLCGEMTILENATAYRDGDTLLQLVSNMD